jgi:hypothetical protein
MDEELTPEQQFAAEDPELMVPKALLAGRAEEDILRDLARLDWTPEAARGLIARVREDLRRYQESPASRRQLVREGRRDVIAGTLLVVLGFVVALFSCLGALGGLVPLYLVAIGVTAVGGALATRGWTRCRLYGGMAGARAPLAEDAEEAGPLTAPADTANNVLASGRSDTTKERPDQSARREHDNR